MPDNATPLILLTRPRAQSERFAASCRARFGERVALAIAPLQEIEAMGAAPDLSGIGSLIFTSENGVLALAGTSPRRDLPAYCVGDRTAEAARAAGFEAVSAGGTAEDLVAMIAAAPPEAPMLHVHGRHLAADVAAMLRDRGIAASGVALYDQVAQPAPPELAAALAHIGPVLVPLFSPRSAALFAAAAAGRAGPGLRVICMSDKVLASLPPAFSACAETAGHPDAEAMLDALARHISP